VTVFRLVGSAGEAGRAGWFLAKLGLAALLSGNVMMFQSLLYFGSLESLGEDVLGTASGIMLILSLTVYLLLGVPMLRVALSAARQGRIVLETLIALGALAAIVASAAEVLRGGRRLYFDSGTMVLVFVALGQYLDARARQKAGETLGPAVTRERRNARVRRNGEEQEIAPEAVQQSERVLVRAGEEIPVDGRVLEGVSDVSEPALTGEATPRLVREGDLVHAGSVAADGALVIEASGESETLARRIERWTAEARMRRAPMEITADRFVAGFIPAVVLVAVASGLGWGLVMHQWERGGLSALSVLVVACPCALGIATPMATTIALSRAAGHGTLLRSGAALEALDRVRTVAFDKTGTMTRGHPALREIRVRANSGLTKSELLGLAATVEVNIDHPFARAIVTGARELGIGIAPARDARSIPGGGAEGHIEGHRVLLGSQALLERESIAQATAAAQRCEEDSCVAVAVDGDLAGEIVLSDATRTGAPEVIAEIQALRVAPRLLSGDRPAVVAKIAREVGIQQAFGGLAPGQKAELLRTWRQGHSGVAMIGDGINDAPALAAADIGIAFGPATDLARQTADVVILGEDLREVPRLFRLARRTMRIVRQNLVWAFGYNTVGILLAAFGYLRPVIAAAAMVLSSLFVVGNSLRLQRPEPERL
jgi:heavy metal translocating P-type ATPase